MFQRGFTKCGSWNKWQKDWWLEIGAKSLGTIPFSTTSENGLPILFYTFEMLIKNPKVVVQTIADFLDESLTEEQMEIILHNSNFKQMSNDQELNLTDQVTGFKFLRKGQIGNWKTYFSKEQISKFETFVEKDMEHLGVIFEYE